MNDTCKSVGHTCLQLPIVIYIYIFFNDNKRSIQTYMSVLVKLLSSVHVGLLQQLESSLEQYENDSVCLWGSYMASF